MIVHLSAPPRAAQRLVVFLLLVAGCGGSAAQSLGCSYGRDIFSENSYRVNGASCQVCFVDRWQAIDTRAPTLDVRCLGSDVPFRRGAAPTSAPNTCGTDDGGVFSDGAIRAERNKCWRCSRSGWTEVDAVKWCNVAQTIDEQRVAPSPVLPGDLEGDLSTIWPGLKVIYALKREEFTALETMVEASLQHRERLRDGEWSLEKLFDGYGDVLPYADQWDEQLSLIRKWRRQSPKSAVAALIEARYWITYAKFALGKEPAAKIPSRARRISGKRASIARSRLTASKAYAVKNPLWYHEMLTVATLQRWRYAKKMALFNKAVTAEPDFGPIYVAMATSLAPRWGGSLAQYRRFVDLAVEKTTPFEGEIMYARLYGKLSELEWRKDPFADLEIPWPEMRAGFIALLERYPESEWSLHSFASFACRAGDARTFASLLPKLTESAASRARGAWRDAYTFDYCRSFFTRKT
jgi:hypothetical protein